MEGREILTSIIYAQYVMLLAGWGLVFIHYGSTAAATWRAQDGKLRGLAGDLLYPIGWAWGRLLCSLRLLSADSCSERPRTRYSAGTILRTAIAVTSISPMLALVRPILGGDHMATTESMLWHSIILTFSCAGAIIHLMVAFREVRARWVAVGTVASSWFFLGPLMIYFLLP